MRRTRILLVTVLTAALTLATASAPAWGDEAPNRPHIHRNPGNPGNPFPGNPNPGGRGGGGGGGGLGASAGPSVMTVSPDRIVQGVHYSGIVITGSGFASDDTVSMGNGVTVNNVSAQGTTQLTVDATVSDTAPTGDTAVSVSENGANGECSGCLTVVPSRVFSLNAYPGFGGGASVAVGNLDADQGDEVVTGAGPGGGPHVIVWKIDPSTGASSVLAQFMAYDPHFTGGVRVAVANVDQASGGEIITGAGPGGGPQVTVWKLDGAGGATPIASWMAYNPGFKGGVYVAAGNPSGSKGGGGDIVTGAGAGGGPDVEVWNLDSNNSPQHLAGFFAYAPNFTGGVNVAVASGTIITGAGPTGGPHVRLWQLAGSLGAPQGNGFMAYDPSFTGGVHVAPGPSGDVVTGPGPGLGEVRMLTSTGSVVAAISPYGAFAGGVNVATGDITGDGGVEVVTVPQTGATTVIGSNLA